MSMNSMSFDIPSVELCKRLWLQWKHQISEDNSSWWEAMHGPFSDKYWKAAITEFETLEAMNVWKVVESC